MKISPTLFVGTIPRLPRSPMPVDEATDKLEHISQRSFETVELPPQALLLSMLVSTLHARLVMA